MIDATADTSIELAQHDIDESSPVSARHFTEREPLLQYCSQIVLLQRLGQIVIHSGFNTLFAVFRHGVCCDSYDCYIVVEYF